jgi:hypothetical protein
MENKKKPTAYKYQGVIIYEHYVREYEVCELIKKELLEKSIKIEIVCAYLEIWESIKKHKVDFIILPWCRNKETLNLIRYYSPNKFNGYYILNLHHEQIANNEKQAFITQDESLNVLHVAWTEKFAKVLIDSGVLVDYIWVTGNPRNDLCNNMSNTSLDLEYNNISKYRPLMLFISSFAYSGLPSNLINNEEFIEPYDKKDILEMVDYTTKSEEEALQWLCYIKKKLKNSINIVYRVHPAQYNKKTIHDKCNEFNLIYNEDYPLREWIKRSDIVLMWRSTSVVECFLLGKLPYRLDLYPCKNIPDLDNIPIVRSLPSFNNKDDLLYEINDILNNNMQKNKNRWDLAKGEAEQYLRSSNKNSLKMISGYLSDVLDGKKGGLLFSPHDPKRAYYINIKYIQFEIKKLLGRIGLLKYFPVYANQLKEWKAAKKRGNEF